MINLNKFILFTTIILSIPLFSCNGQNDKSATNNSIDMIEELPWHDFDKMEEIAKADYGKCYTIGKYQLCPEKNLIRVECMYGTAVKDCMGWFPDPSLKYDEEKMIILGGLPFFDKSGLNIDWQSVKLLSHVKDYAEFTDGNWIYCVTNENKIDKIGKYDKNSYAPPLEEKYTKRNLNGVKELTKAFYVKNNIFYFGSFVQDEDGDGYILTPIIEPFDVPNLHTIVSKNGLETDFITDGKLVMFGGVKTGCSLISNNGEKYVLAKEWMVENIDFKTLRVLGKNMLADKNALYYGTEVIPFAELKGFKFIIKEL